MGFLLQTRTENCRLSVEAVFLVSFYWMEIADSSALLQFEKWLNENGASFPKIRFVSFHSEGNGGIAKEDIASG